jgi:hypothetical protein
MGAEDPIAVKLQVFSCSEPQPSHRRSPRPHPYLGPHVLAMIVPVGELSLDDAFTISARWLPEFDYLETLTFQELRPLRASPLHTCMHTHHLNIEARLQQRAPNVG